MESQMSCLAEARVCFIMIIFLICLLTAEGVLSDDLDDYPSMEVLDTQLQFATDLFRRVLIKHSSENIGVSPSSIFDCFVFIYHASAGHTEKEVEKLLRFNQYPILKKKKSMLTYGILVPWPGLIDYPKSEYDMDLVYRIFHAKKIKVRNDRVKLFGKKLYEFKPGDKREDVVNKWISEATKGIIPHLLPEGSLKGDDDRVVIANAAYFKSQWKYPFQGGTSLKTFSLSDGSVTHVPFMSLNSDLASFKSVVDQKLRAQIISLPFKAPVSMLVILPTRPSLLDDVVSKLSSDKIHEIFTTFKGLPLCRTDLLMPKFQMESGYDLKPILSDLGGKELLEDKNLDLTNLFEPTSDLQFDKLYHKIKINVHENGTEAVAATVVSGTNSLPPQCHNTVHVDRPFVYLIYNHVWSVIHYIGVVNKP